MKALQNILRTACATFSVIALCANLAVILFLDPATDGLLPQMIFGFFGFSLAFGVANHVYFKTEINSLLRYFIHLALTVGSAVAVLMIPSKNNGPAALFIGVCLIVVHLLFFLIYNVKHMGKDKKEEYKPLYDKLKRD